METLCITGISGYVGSRLLERFENDADVGKIIGIDVKPPRIQSKKLVFYNHDIRKDLSPVLSEHKPQSLIHLAFILNPVHDGKLMREINVDGTRNAAESAGKAGITHAVVASSATAYGAHPDNPDVLTEDAPLRGNKEFQYAHEKKILEEVCLDAQKKYPHLKFCFLRPCVILGPNVNNYLSRFSDMPVAFRIRGTNPPLQFVHEDDVGEIFYRAWKSKLAGAYNVAPDDSMTITDIAKLSSQKVMEVPPFIAYPLASLLWTLRVGEAPASYLDFFRYPWVLSNGKIKTALNYAFQYSTKETLTAFMRAKGKI